MHVENRTIDRGPLFPPQTVSELWVSAPGVLVNPPPRGTQPITLDRWKESATFFTATPLWSSL